MRVVANYSTSLFDYINSDKNLKEVLSQGADESLLSEGAKKTLREKGISLNGSTTKDASVYETVQETAESVRDSVIAFTGSDAESLFTTAESSGSTAKIVTEVKSFVENYNAFASAVKEMGGSENTTYLEQMNELLSKDSDAYEKIGITFAEDGTLTLDEKVLDGASVQDLKTAFYKDNDLEEIAQKSIRVQANAISGKYAATVSNYTDSGTYSNSKKMPHGNSYGELVLCGIFVIVFLMYFGLLFRKRWYILVPKKGKKMENKRNYEVRKTVFNHTCHFIYR